MRLPSKVPENDVQWHVSIKFQSNLKRFEDAEFVVLYYFYSKTFSVSTACLFFGSIVTEDHSYVDCTTSTANGMFVGGGIVDVNDPDYLLGISLEDM
jgi:hypothetical protein